MSKVMFSNIVAHLNFLLNSLMTDFFYMCRKLNCSIDFFISSHISTTNNSTTNNYIVVVK